jgi:hypothetical protein
VFFQGADTRNAEKILQFVQEPLLVTTGITHCGGSHKGVSLSRSERDPFYGWG